MQLNLAFELAEPSGCLPCHGSCKTCFGPEINHCLSCQKEKQLFNSRCITKHSWWSGTQKSVQGIILALISVCALLLLIIGEKSYKINSFSFRTSLTRVTKQVSLNLGRSFDCFVNIFGKSIW